MTDDEIRTIAVRTIATRAMNSSSAWPAVFAAGAAAVLWDAAVAALAAKGYVITKREEHFGR